MDYLRSKKKLLTIAFILLISFLILFLAKGSISGNDFWWHVKTGEYIVTNGVVPKTDPFSWYGIENNLEWTAHEWLSGVIFYTLYSNFGEIGVFITCVSLAIVMCSVLITMNRNYLPNKFIFSFIYIAVALLGLSSFFYGRPHMLSFFLLFTVLYCLYSFLDSKNKKLVWLIPLVTVLWANVHGGSSNLPYILIILAIFASAFNIKIGKIESKKLPFSDIKN